jgi:hypothetical protein
MSQRRPLVIAAAAGAGIALGLFYSLSPMTVLCLPVLVAVAVWAGRGLSPRERRWFISLLVVAVLARLTVIAGLFLTAAPDQPFATLFGDEQFFKYRSLWIRNIGLGVAVSPADMIYAYDDLGRSSYLYLLAFLQALFGDLPYGVHVLNATVYLAGVLMAYRYIRPVFGGAAALAGLALLLFFPSLFVWSVSALKEPSYTFVAVVEMLCCLWLVRGTRWPHRAAAGIGLVACILTLESLRRGGLAVGLAGSGAGLALGLIGKRPKLIWVALAGTPLLCAALIMTPAINERILGLVRSSAVYHAGHIMSEGYSYKILDSRYYHDRKLLQGMKAREASQYVVRSVISYATEPVPWRAESAGLRAYLPEQMLWYVLLAFVPVGLIAGFRRDPVLTGLLASHAVALVMMVALTSGNIGTLIRHRGLALPYLAWLSGLGFCQVLRTLTSASPSSGGVNPHGDR